MNDLYDKANASPLRKMERQNNKAIEISTYRLSTFAEGKKETVETVFPGLGKLINSFAAGEWANKTKKPIPTSRNGKQ
jgi:hypothetical protein